MLRDQVTKELIDRGSYGRTCVMVPQDGSWEDDADARPASRKHKTTTRTILPFGFESLTSSRNG